MTSDRVTLFKLEFFVGIGRMELEKSYLNRYTTKMSTKNIRLEGNGRIEVGKGRTRTDDVWKEKKNGKFGKTLGCKKHEEEYENCRRYGQRGEYGRVRENVIRCRK